MSKKTNCTCWDDKDTRLREMGFKISDACSGLQVEQKTLALRAKYGLPLQRVDGKRPLRSDPKMIEISNCPFCGKTL